MMPPPNLWNIPLLTRWGIWRGRNRKILQDNAFIHEFISAHITANYNLLLDKDISQCPRTITKETIDHSKPWAYFDGASKHGRCGGGAVLHLLESHHFQIKARLGQCTNKFVELHCLKLLLLFSIENNCGYL